MSPEQHNGFAVGFGVDVWNRCHLISSLRVHDGDGRGHGDGARDLVQTPFIVQFTATKEVGHSLQRQNEGLPADSA